MIGDLFDSPWKILIVAVVLIVLFGSRKLPSAARSLGQSMRILKKEVQGLHEDEPELRAAGAQPAAQAPAARIAGERFVQSRRRQNPGGRMPLLDHLWELRNRVVKMAFAMVAGMIAGFV